MGALITIDVHARDVVRFMVKSGVCSVSDFEWTKQLRYYWEVSETHSTLWYTFKGSPAQNIRRFGGVRTTGVARVEQNIFLTGVASQLKNYQIHGLFLMMTLSRVWLVSFCTFVVRLKKSYPHIFVIYVT